MGLFDFFIDLLFNLYVKLLYLEGLFTYCSDYDLDMRYKAEEAIGKIRDPRAVEPLIGLLTSKQYLLKDKYRSAYDVYVNAAKALGNIGDSRAVEPLVNLLNDQQFMHGNCDCENVRKVAVEALGKIGGPKAIKTLIDLCKYHPGMLSGDCFKALVEIGKDAVEPLIYAFFKLLDGDGRGPAAIALGDIGDARAVEPLINALKHDKSSYVRCCVVIALEEIGDPRAIEPLINALNDEGYSNIHHHYVCEKAKKALDKLRNKKPTD